MTELLAEDDTMQEGDMILLVSETSSIFIQFICNCFKSKLKCIMSPSWETCVTDSSEAAVDKLS